VDDYRRRLFRLTRREVRQELQELLAELDERIHRRRLISRLPAADQGVARAIAAAEDGALLERLKAAQERGREFDRGRAAH